MASGSPRGRIDQFFASKKNKTKNSSLPKGEKTSSQEKPANFDCSPSSKGSLSGFLVSSPSTLRPKRNLSREVGVIADASCNRVLLSRSSSGEVSERAIDTNVPLRASDDARGKEVLDIGTSGVNSEIKKFASDFLSLYCSDLPSSSEPAFFEQDPKRLKRTERASLSYKGIEDSRKKQRLGIREKQNSANDEGCYQEIDTENNPLLTEMGAPHPVNLNETSDGASEANHRGSISVLKRCKNISYNTSNAVPGTPFSRTPKSLNRPSIFSPGDEFWDEAIQVVDGLYIPAEKFYPTRGDRPNAPSDLKELQAGESSTFKVFKEKASSTIVDGGKYLSSMTKCNMVSQNMALNCLEESIIDHHNELSPLPVKRFDFSYEGSNCIRDDFILKDHNATTMIDGAQECNPIPVSGIQKADVSFTVSCTPNNEFVPVHVSSVLKAQDQFPVQKSPKSTGKDKPAPLSVAGCGIPIRDKVKNLNLHSLYNVSTPSSSLPLKDSLQLSSWLPYEICSIYTKKGISCLYPWQVDCLQVDGVLEKRNLIYCASTSSGKSIVAEILMLKRVILSGKMAILVLPYVSLCAEKAEHLELLLEPLGKRVRSFYGNQGGGSLPKDTCIAVCTIEKANSLVNRFLEEARLSEVGIIVIDELHMVGDQHRGYLLELLLTKLRYASGEGNSGSASGESSGSSSSKGDPSQGLQIIGMSATMPNVSAVADWLHAALYQTDFRPVPLEEFIKVGDTIFNKNMDVVRKLPKSADIGGKDPDHIVELCNEVVQEGHSVLLFCSSRKGCESTARHVSKFLNKISFSAREACEFNDADSAIEALRKCPSGLDPILEETLPFGVAYHHAGLTVEEREIIETCYRKGLVRVLTATSTLAAGVNLPARRVIFRQPLVGLDFIDGTRYRQMAGRAGRTGIDTRGESILICKPEEIKRVSSIINDMCPPLQSCLSEDKNGMTHAILEVVAGGIVQTASDVNRYVKCTLLNSTKPFEDVVKSAQDSLRWLCHKKFLEWNEGTKLYGITPLGRAAFGSSLNPDESLVVLDDLLRAREGVILASDLHLVYLVTPTNVDIEPDWDLFYERYMELSTLDQSVASRVGVAEPFLMRMAHGAPMPGHDRSRGKKKVIFSRLQKQSSDKGSSLCPNEQSLRVAKRLYVALMLSRLVQEVPVADVCDAFKVARGMIQALQENAGRFASMVSVFCERLGWHDLEGLVAKFQNRVSFGVRAEIVELTNIPYVKGSRARALYKAGLRTAQAIAEASISEITKALFEFSSWAGQEASTLRPMQLGVAKKIRNGARKVVLDQAEEARMAAFSAFKSLGFQVPQFSQPLVLTRSNGRDEDKKTTSSEDALSYPDAMGTKKNSASVDSTAENRQGCLNDSPEAVEGSGHSTELNTIAGASREETHGVGHNEGALDVVSEPDKVGGNIRIDFCSNIINQNIIDRGPLHASKVPGGFDCFLDQWSSTKEFCFDVHFVKCSVSDCALLFELLGMAVCWDNSPVFYVNFSKDLLSAPILNRSVETASTSENKASSVLCCSSNLAILNRRWSRISEIMMQKGVRKITWNLKVQMQVLKLPRVSLPKLGRLIVEPNDLVGVKVLGGSHILLPSIFVHDGIDVCLVSWILWPDEESKYSPSLEKLVKKRLSSDAAASTIRNGRWINQMHKAAHNGCCRRAAQIRALNSVLWKLLVSENLVEPIIEIENPLVKVLADMELWGVGINMEASLKARHILLKKLKKLEEEAYHLVGMTFSLSTSADVANVLYKHLKLPIPVNSKGKQHPSTDKRALELLRGQHPIISVIKEHRTLSKILHNTLGSICARARPCAESQRYIIQGHWLQTSTATGRLAMEEPNLQCVQHTVTFSSPNSSQVNKTSEIEQHQINPRDFVTPTQENWLILTADYSQIELRIMAHFSKDCGLVELLTKTDGDVFTMIASRWIGKTESAVIPEEREQTKRLVYGILYGMGASALAENLGCSSEEAIEKISTFKSSFPGVTSWLLEAVALCRQRGYIQTLCGRKRFLSKIKFGNDEERAKAQRQAVNSICQGSAADIIKTAMIKIHSLICEGHEPSDLNAEARSTFSSFRGHCRIILQVHDELVLEVDPILVKEAGLLLQSSMEGAASLLVPLKVKLKVGKTWGSLQPFQP